MSKVSSGQRHPQVREASHGPTHTCIPPRRSVHRPGVGLRWPASVLWRDGEPEVRKIATDDVWSALSQGIDDFRAMPTHVFFACLIYPVVGIVLARLAFGYELLHLLYPMAAGFALLGPFVAIGLYELSRRREQGLHISPVRAFDVLKRPAMGAIWDLALCWRRSLLPGST